VHRTHSVLEGHHSVSSRIMVRDLHIGRSRIGPSKADAPFVIDADAVLSRSVASQRFQAVSRRRPQVVEFYCCLNHCEFAGCGTLNSTEPL
jgi:hypothetical protein